MDLGSTIGCEATARGRNSAVECQLPKLDVAGSNPVARFFTSLSKPAMPYYEFLWTDDIIAHLDDTALTGRIMRRLYPILAVLA